MQCKVWSKGRFEYFKNHLVAKNRTIGGNSILFRLYGSHFRTNIRTIKYLLLSSLNMKADHLESTTLKLNCIPQKNGQTKS